MSDTTDALGTSNADTPDTPVEVTHGDYTVLTDRARIEVAAVHDFLAKSYRSPGIPEETLRRAIAGAICFGVYRGTEQVRFARVIMSHPALRGLRRFSLSTRDAHALYTQFGFWIVANPERQMEILRPNVYMAPADVPTSA